MKPLEVMGDEKSGRTQQRWLLSRYSQDDFYATDVNDGQGPVFVHVPPEDQQWLTGTEVEYRIGTGSWGRAGTIVTGYLDHENWYWIIKTDCGIFLHYHHHNVRPLHPKTYVLRKEKQVAASSLEEARRIANETDGPWEVVE